MSAISLQASLFSAASTLGPALGGFAVGLLGYADNFFLNGASLIPVLITLYAMRLTDRSRDHPQSAWKEIRESLNVVRRDCVLPWVLTGYGALLCFGPSPALILPVVAVKILGVGPERLGFLFSSVGLGSILGALILASLRSGARKGYQHQMGILIWVGALSGCAVSSLFLLSLAALFLLGMGQSFVATTSITLLQTGVPEQMRGRLMSLNTLLLMGIRLLGISRLPRLISAIGAPSTLLLSSALVAAYAAVAALARPSIRSA